MNTTDKEIDLIGDAYKNYCKQNDEILGRSDLWTLTKQEFIDKIKTDDEFAKKWGLKIEERELSDEESVFHYEKQLYSPLRIIDKKIPVVPTKLITITYNNETIESYE